MPTACKEPEGKGEMLAGGAGPRGLPTPLPSTLFPPYGSHKVWAQRQQPEEVAVYRELLCGRGGEGEGARRKEGRKGGKRLGTPAHSPLRGSGTPCLSEVRGPEEIHVPPGVAGGHQSPGSRTHQPFLEMLGTRRCRAQGLTSEALGRRRSHPCFAGLSPSCTRDGGLKIQPPFIPEWGQDSEWVIYRIIQNLCKNPDTPDPPKEVCFCYYGSPLWAGLLGMGRWAGMRSLVLVSLRISPKRTGKSV